MTETRSFRGPDLYTARFGRILSYVMGAVLGIWLAMGFIALACYGFSAAEGTMPPWVGAAASGAGLAVALWVIAKIGAFANRERITRQGPRQ